jgi:signal transduction histidine kinase
MKTNVRIVGFLVGAMLLAVCGTALAGGQDNNSYDGSGALSVWRMSKRSEQQILLDYAERLKNQLALKPGDIATEMELGRTYYWMAIEEAGNTPAVAEAEKCFEDVLSRDPNNAAALGFHGCLLGTEIGNRLVPDADVPRVGAQAMEEMDRGVALAPDSLEIRFLRAYAGMYTPSSVGRNNLVIEDFKFIISRFEVMPGGKDGLAEAYLGLGDTYNKVGRHEEAAAAWQHAARLGPGSEHATVAASRLGVTPEGWGVGNPRDARQLAAFFGFLIGLAIFAILAGRLLSDLLHTHRNRANIAASFLVSLIAFVWNGLNLLAILASLRPTMPKLLAQTVGSNHGGLYLVFALSPIPLGLLLAYKFHKATFMDVILKKGAALLIVLALAVINAYIWADLVTLSSFEVLNATLRPAIFTAIWLSLFALYLPLRGRVYALVDRYLLHRRDYSHLIESLTDRARSATDEEAFKRVVSETFQEAFTAEFVRFLAPENELATRIAAELDRHHTQVLLTRDVSDEDLYLDLESRRVELVLGIMSASDLQGISMFGPRAYGQGYLSEELKLLRAVAGHVAPLLENMQLHVVRRQQAVAEQELRKLATQAELKALRAQIDPHFFFNALNSVASLIGEDPGAAEDLVGDISELFRHAFRPNREFITLGQEVELVETYLKVERARFGERLVFENSVSPLALAIKIPALSIQPLIENAVKHGISKSSLPGVITLSVSIDRDNLSVSVQDTGPGISPSELSDIYSRGVGLSNVDSRLIALYGEGARLNIDSRIGQGARVSFVIPARLVSSELPAEVQQV